MLEFRYASSEHFERELTAHIRRVSPRATVNYNDHGNLPFSWEVGQRPVQHARNGDFVTGETGVLGFSALTVGLNAEFYRAAAPGQPFQIAMQRGVRMYHDQTTRPLNDLRWELFTLLSHGGFVTIVDKTAFDGGLDPVAYERFGAAFKEVHAKRQHFGQRPVYEVALYFSSRTRDWVGRDKPADFFQSFQGAHKAMEYEHIPWGEVLDENATLESMKQFPVVLLPNVAIVSDKEIASFRRYVEEGGKLLVTGLSGTRGWRCESNCQSGLSELIGARFIRELDSTDNWVRLDEKERGELSRTQLGKGISNHWPFLVRGPAVVYGPATAASLAELLKPHRTSLHAENRYNKDWPLSAEAPVGPAVLLKHSARVVLNDEVGNAPWFEIGEDAPQNNGRLLRQSLRREGQHIACGPKRLGGHGCSAEPALNRHKHENQCSRDLPAGTPRMRRQPFCPLRPRDSNRIALPERVVRRMLACSRGRHQLVPAGGSRAGSSRMSRTAFAQ